MMYPYLTLNDDTEITHSEMLPDGRVKVYIETPDLKDGFHNATCFLPEYEWVDINGYSENEMNYFKKLIRDNAHLIMEFSQEGASRMPQIFRIGSYIVYFWSNENDPLEPVHVHIAEGRASANATKIWITSAGKALLCNNNSKIPQRELRRMVRIIEANSALILDKWYSQFGEIRYYL